jgi:hypothetical protein
MGDGQRQRALGLYPIKKRDRHTRSMSRFFIKLSRFSSKLSRPCLVNVALSRYDQGNPATSRHRTLHSSSP